MSKVVEKNEVKGIEFFKEILGNERELHVLRGQLLNPVIMTKKDSTGHYLAFRLKTIRSINDDEYGQRNNNYQIIVSEEKAKKITSEFFRNVKDQEVLVLVDVVNMLRKSNNGPLYFNNVSYYLIDIIKIRDIVKKTSADIPGSYEEI